MEAGRGVRHPAPPGCWRSTSCVSRPGSSCSRWTTPRRRTRSSRSRATPRTSSGSAGSWTLDKETPFVGRAALRREQAAGGPPRRLVGLDLDWTDLERLYAAQDLSPALSAAAWRQQIPVYAAGRQVGRATSGTWSPGLKQQHRARLASRRATKPPGSAARDGVDRRGPARPGRRHRGGAAVLRPAPQARLTPAGRDSAPDSSPSASAAGRASRCCRSGCAAGHRQVIAGRTAARGPVRLVRCHDPGRGCRALGHHGSLSLVSRHRRPAHASSARTSASVAMPRVPSGCGCGRRGASSFVRSVTEVYLGLEDPLRLGTWLAERGVPGHDLRAG